MSKCHSYLWKSKQIGREISDDDGPGIDTIDLSHIPQSVHKKYEDGLAAMMKYYADPDSDQSFKDVIFSTQLTLAAVAVCGLSKRKVEEGTFMLHLAEKEAQVMASPDIPKEQKFEMVVMCLCGNIFLEMGLDIEEERVNKRLFWAANETVAFFWRKWSAHRPHHGLDS